MNILLTGCFQYSEAQLNELHALGLTLHYVQQESETLPIPASDIDGVVCNGLFLSHDIDCFTRLKYIQLTSAGLDRVPMEKIQERHILIHNAHGVYNTPLAEWVLFRVLEHYKQGWFFRAKQLEGTWEKHRGLKEIEGCKVAIVGAGSVGQAVAQRFASFGAEVTGFDLTTTFKEGFHSMFPVHSLPEKVEEYDILVLTLPLTDSTRKMIDRQMLRKMKHDAMLLNISRGGVVDEEALFQVLKERPDLFAALDVFEDEPLSSSSLLWTLPNVALSPHNAFVGNGNNARMFELIHHNLQQFVSSQK